MQSHVTSQKTAVSNRRSLVGAQARFPGRGNSFVTARLLWAQRETAPSLGMQKSTTTNTDIENTTRIRLVTAPKAFPMRPDITPRRRLSRSAIGAVVALAALPAAFAQPSFFVTELPVPAGYEACAPYQINDQGFVAGDSQRGNDRVATIWKGGKAQLLGKLDKGTYSSAMAINSTGVAT